MIRSLSGGAHGRLHLRQMASSCPLAPSGRHLSGVRFLDSVREILTDADQASEQSHRRRTGRRPQGEPVPAEPVAGGPAGPQ
jgi:hypothetical protein